MKDYKDDSVWLMLGDCLERMKEIPDGSVDSIVTDPPYGLGFMGKHWDKGVPSAEIWSEALRVLKPGGHLLAFAGTRTQHRMAVNIEDAGFEIRDMIAWVYGCLSEDTEVLINGEWVQYHKANVGDLALCYNNENDTYEWQPIEDTHKYEYGDTAYRICSNNTDQIVSRNHRVLVERGGAYEFEYAENLARERQIRVPILESLPTLLDDLSVREPVRVESGTQAVRGARYTVSDLADIEPVHYEGIVWCLTVPTGAFVVRRNGKVFVTGNSGFPKSMDVSKAIDKAAGAEREVVGRKANYHSEGKRSGTGVSQHGVQDGSFSNPDLAAMITAPATEAARQWQGWGTSLKPALEPVTVARKPFKGTVAANVLEHGTAALNIDGCRVAAEAGGRPLREVAALRDDVQYGGNALAGRVDGSLASSKAVGSTDLGRWPANLIHDGSDEVLAAFPTSASPWIGNPNTGKKGGKMFGGSDQAINEKPEYRDAGSAARFFYCAKASKKDRGEDNKHPTVKPTDLMAYLCRLVTPPGGTVLDPFMGSGSTGKAALREGFRFIGIELDSQYFDIAKERILNVEEVQFQAMLF